MAYNTKTIIRDSQSVPVPQYFNPATDAYEVIQGANGAMPMMIYDASGNSLLTVTNPGQVTVTASALPTGASTEAKQDSIVGLIDALETLLTAIKDTAGIKKITDALPAGTNNIGDVDVLSLPPIPAGANLIGEVKIGKTFKGLPSATPIYFISTVANTLLYVSELSAAGIVTGQKTISTTAVEVYAGASSRLASRFGLKVTSATTNTSNVFFGATGVTALTGDILFPGDSVIIEFTL